ncbi:MAG TPA: OmpA family protein [Flavobacteriaceae bacterium]|nr:OmpA family protein [Flavobacteriaceae bacterium]
MRYLFVIILCFNFSIGQNKLNHEVYFETNKFEVPSTEENRLLLFITSLDTISIEKIAIYGFCDDRGAENYNLKLSQERADAIKAIFSDNEISESLITNVDGKGEILLNIVREDDLVKIRGLNRKVEIIVTKKTLEKNSIKDDPEKKATAELLKENLKVGDRITFENILFKNGYSYISSKESKQTLDHIAEVLSEKKDIYFTIQGHVCCTQNTRDAVDKQTKKRNLSLARAKYVYEYLAKKGVDKKRMKYVGMRRKFPLGGDPKFDRRVEILITYVGESD